MSIAKTVPLVSVHTADAGQKLNQHRPNTAVPDSLLRAKMVLCCGEDADGLLRSLHTISQAPWSQFHEYRCYKFWRFDRFTLCWSGIGTGCLEPLLYEILDTDRINGIVLVGTAGAISGRGIDLGRAYLIDRAFLAGAAVRLRDDVPLTPRFPDRLLEQSGLEQATVASTDYYYGFSQDCDPRSNALRERDDFLIKDLARLWNRVRMVDMETAQFYHFCSILGGVNINYVAVRGAANFIGRHNEQIANTSAVLKATLGAALKLLEIVP